MPTAERVGALNDLIVLCLPAFALSAMSRMLALNLTAALALRELSVERMTPDAKCITFPCARSALTALMI